MHGKNTVILDKSYLYGAPTSAVRSLCLSHTVLVTPALFYEVMKDDQRARANCFRKFPDGENSVQLIDRVGSLIRFEMEEKARCLPILNHRVPGRFFFNPSLAKGDFEGSPALWRTMNEEERLIQEDTTAFLQCISSIPKWFPELSTCGPGQSRYVIDRIQERVARDSTLLQALYEATHDHRFPPKELVDETWAIARRLQVWVMGGLEYIFQYGNDQFDTVSDKVVHSYLDIQYAIHACLAGGLATRDKFLKCLFHLLVPSGNLVE